MPKKRKGAYSQQSPISSSSVDKIVETTHTNNEQRMPCYCEGSKHKLINNCINCGRIVCSVERSGPCFTCGDLVYTVQQQEILRQNNEASQKLRSKLAGENLSFDRVKGVFSGICNDQEREKAVAHKNKLLQFNNTLAKRTTLITDLEDCDPEANKWLTSSQRAKLLEKREKEYESRHGSRRSQVVTFDFAGRSVIEEIPSTPDFLDEILDDNISIYKQSDCTESEDIDYKPKYCVTYPPILVPKNSERSTEEEKKKKNIRIQDKDIQFMSDTGMCLTIGQPYASLIIAGIKTCEGRHWCTSFRGRLWIHSKMASPNPEDIAAAESVYRNLVVGATNFPSEYPTGVILGCVDLTDCLTQEEYREKYPHGECGSEYVFICENPRSLQISIPMRGKRKIYKMEYKFHEAAKKLLK